MARLPQPGGDLGQWGQILNDYLGQSHNSDGSLKAGSVSEVQLSSALQVKVNNVASGGAADDSISTAKLQNNAVTAAKLADDSVDTSAVQNNSVNNDKLQDGSVTAAKLASSSVSNAALQNNSVTTAKIAAGGIAPTAITGTAVVNNDTRLTDTRTPINDSVSTIKIQNSAVTAAKIANDTITNSNISPSANIAQSKIADLTTDLTDITSALTTKADSSSLAAKANNSDVVHNTGDESITGNKTLSGVTTFSGTVLVPTPTAAGHAATKTYVDGVVANGGTPDADATTKGVVRLAGDLTGSATAPIVASGSITNAKIANATITQAKLDAALSTKIDTAAGGGSVSNATTTTTGVVQLAGDLAGTATSPTITNNAITNAKISSSAAIAQSKIANLTTDLNTINTTLGTKADQTTVNAKQSTSEKGQPNGYASLNSSSRIPATQLGSGTADGTTYLRGDGSWVTVSSGTIADGSIVEAKLDTAARAKLNSASSEIMRLQFTGLDDLLATDLSEYPILGNKTISKIIVNSSTSTNQDIVAEVVKNGVPLYTGTARPTIASGQKTGSITPNTALVDGDKLSFYLAQQGAASPTSQAYEGFVSTNTTTATFDTSTMQPGELAILVLRAQLTNLTFTPGSGVVQVGQAYAASGGASTIGVFAYRAPDNGAASSVSVGMSGSTTYQKARLVLGNAGDIYANTRWNGTTTGSSSPYAWTAPTVDTPRVTNAADPRYITHIVVAVGEAQSTKTAPSGYTEAVGNSLGSTRINISYKTLGQPKVATGNLTGSSTAASESTVVWSLLVPAKDPGTNVTLALQLT